MTIEDERLLEKYKAWEADMEEVLITHLHPDEYAVIRDELAVVAMKYAGMLVPEEVS